MKVHVTRVHEGKRESECQQCDKKFSFPSELKRHIDSVHKGIKNFQCDKCDAKYDRASSLKEHIKYIHMGHARAKNQCDKCGKAFGTPGYLEKHTLTVHEGLVQKVTCEHCGKNFTSNAYLKNHVQIVHQQIRNHQCDKCDKSFGQRGKLRILYIKSNFNKKLKINLKKCNSILVYIVQSPTSIHCDRTSKNVSNFFKY